MARGDLVSKNYLNNSIAPVKNLSLPSKIKCLRCSKVKPPTSYSTVKQNDLKRALADPVNRNADPTKTGFVPCVNCVGGQMVEMRCFYCDKWMALNKFTKVQRKTPDQATCQVCMKERMDTELDTVESDRGTSDDDDDSYHNSDSDGDAPSVPTAAGGGASLRGSSATFHSNSSQQGGVSVVAPSTTRSTAPTSQRSSTAGGSTGRRGSMTSTTTASTMTAYGNGKFARVAAGPRQQDTSRPRRESLDHLQVEESDSDSD